jgi:anti-sigma factor RsiW
MTERECETIRDLLVDYADGELAAADGQRVAAHLESCADCRAEMRLLERSLEVARAVWHELAAGAERPVGWAERSESHQDVVESELVGLADQCCASVPVGPPYESAGVAVQLPPQHVATRQAGRRRRFAATALAAAIVLVLAVLPWLVPHGGAPLATRPKAGPRTLTAGNSPNLAVMSRKDIERYIAREAASARLYAAAQLLGTQPGLEAQRQRAEQYIIETYSDTAAGRELSARAATKPTKEPQS